MALGSPKGMFLSGRTIRISVWGHPVPQHGDLASRVESVYLCKLWVFGMMNSIVRGVTPSKTARGKAIFILTYSPIHPLQNVALS